MGPKTDASKMRKPKRTYGAKKSAFSSASTAIFGSNMKQEPSPPARSALEDITDAVKNITLAEKEKEDSVDVIEEKDDTPIERGMA
ncbi:hypothetical protein M7I_1575 [Glarea lozoyensis 74030]|uniref:Uncharacterized protein n=1 Tax=Glarea lozoyensis (strain ATCC 74030 / MF5533) TaxID=1104152 RepID=H0EGF9_GLAL7|nr:hypothetical protein M7I_1575 [Glarea lozoyensis 74030]